MGLAQVMRQIGEHVQHNELVRLRMLVVGAYNAQGITPHQEAHATEEFALEVLEMIEDETPISDILALSADDLLRRVNGGD